MVALEVLLEGVEHVVLGFGVAFGGLVGAPSGEEGGKSCSHEFVGREALLGGELNGACFVEGSSVGTACDEMDTLAKGHFVKDVVPVELLWARMEGSVHRAVEVDG
jgi:hypothetical protein